MATKAELEEEIHRIRRRISSLERALDSVLTNDDLRAIEEDHEDLNRGRTVSLAVVKKKRS